MRLRALAARSTLFAACSPSLRALPSTASTLHFMKVVMIETISGIAVNMRSRVKPARCFLPRAFLPFHELSTDPIVTIADMRCSPPILANAATS